MGGSFESKTDMERFKIINLVAAQVSAVAVTSKTSTNIKYAEGVMVFTMQRVDSCMRGISGWTAI
jgi:hypothetical protein